MIPSSYPHHQWVFPCMTVIIMMVLLTNSMVMIAAQSVGVPVMPLTRLPPESIEEIHILPNQRRLDCNGRWSSGTTNIALIGECGNWGTCNLTYSTYNETLASRYNGWGIYRAFSQARWHCQCVARRYETDGTPSSMITTPTCGYSMYTVPSVQSWTVPWWLANGVLCAVVVACALATLSRMYQIDKFRKNLSSLALICICISFLQQTLGQFMLAARGDGYFIEAPSPIALQPERMNTTTEIVVGWFVSTLSYIPILTAYHALYFYFVRLAMPMMPQVSPLGAIGTPRQIKMMIAAMIILIALVPLTLISDQYQTLYGSIYMIWKALFGVLFCIAGIRARRMLARTLPPSDQSVRGSRSNDGNNNGAIAAVAPVVGASSMVYLSHGPLPTKVAPSPVPLSPLAGIVTLPHRVQAFGAISAAAALPSPATIGNANNDGGVLPVTTLTNSNSSRHQPPQANNNPPASPVAGDAPLPLFLPSPIPSSPRAASSSPAASRRVHAPMIVVMNDGLRRTLLRNVILLSTCGGLVSIIQAGLFLWLGLSSDHSSAQTRIILSMCVTPLNCVWGALLIATYWIPKRQLPKRVYHNHHDDRVDSNNDSGVNESL